MKANTKNVVMGLIAPIALIGLFALNSALAREPFTKAELAAQEKALLAAVDHGRDLWHGTKPSMTTNGLACGNCHPDAAASNPQTFPKYQANLGKVIPIRDMINWCIIVPQGGQALDVNSDDMTAMEAYATYMHRGVAIDPGLATKQTSAVVVKSGPGFPKKGSGVGYDQ
ncbi:MAG: cytochrome C [Gallionella sp.]|nr:cytochrome C [Gallionella sp.]